MIGFWFITVLLLICAFGFILPWLSSFRGSAFTVFILSISAYGLYLNLGSSQYLSHYYSEAEQLVRIKQLSFRPLLAEFRKEEFRLKLRLEENPNDLDAEWRLLDLLAIKALHNGNRNEALQYWERALVKMPESYKPQFKEKISNFIRNTN